MTTMLEWRPLPPRAGAPWPLEAQLEEIRSTQHEHPAEWAELRRGAYSTMRTYARHLRGGRHPGRRSPIDVAGFEFRTTTLGEDRAVLWARFSG